MHIQNIRQSAIKSTSYNAHKPTYMDRILDKQNAPSEAIKHQRDKQILIVYRADI